MVTMMTASACLRAQNAALILYHVRVCLCLRLSARSLRFPFERKVLRVAQKFQHYVAVRC
jgi:hypothetical protein